jgi:hypothetical protein
MSQNAQEGAVMLATLTERLGSATIKVASTESSEAVLIGLAGAIPLVMTVAGILSRSISESKGRTEHPASYATEDNILLASLLLARSAILTPCPSGTGISMSLTPDLYADALRDFTLLRPQVSLDSFVRSDVLAMASDNRGVDGGELLAGILSKRLN